MTDTIERLKKKLAATYDTNHIEFWERISKKSAGVTADEMLIQKYRNLLSQRLKSLEMLHDVEKAAYRD